MLLITNNQPDADHRCDHTNNIHSYHIIFQLHTVHVCAVTSHMKPQEITKPFGFLVLIKD